MVLMDYQIKYKVFLRKQVANIYFSHQLMHLYERFRSWYIYVCVFVSGFGESSVNKLYLYETNRMERTPSRRKRAGNITESTRFSQHIGQLNRTHTSRMLARLFSSGGSHRGQTLSYCTRKYYIFIVVKIPMTPQTNTGKLVHFEISIHALQLIWGRGGGYMQ